MRQVLGVVHLMVLYAGMLLVAQFLVFALSFGRHETNQVYRFIRFLTSPVVRATRAITPGKIDDRHVPVVAFLLLFWIYVALALGIPMVGRSA
jgi:hypothetical protein